MIKTPEVFLFDEPLSNLDAKLRGTHQYEKLVRPEELERPLVASGMDIVHRTGVFYNVLQDSWNLSPDMDVNYMMLAKRPS